MALLLPEIESVFITESVGIANYKEHCQGWFRLNKKVDMRILVSIVLLGCIQCSQLSEKKEAATSPANNSGVSNNVPPDERLPGIVEPKGIRISE